MYSQKGLVNCLQLQLEVEDLKEFRASAQYSAKAEEVEGNSRDH